MTQVIACPDLHTSRESPNGWRLSGAEGIRCRRGFGEIPDLVATVPSGDDDDGDE